MTTVNSMWVLYLISASVGYYCFRCIPFGVKKGGVLDSIIRTLGLTLLFTPVPISAYATDLAPGFVTIPFTVMQSGLDSIQYAVPWYGTISLIALFLVIATRKIGLNSVAPEQTVVEKLSVSQSELVEESIKKEMAGKAPNARKSKQSGRKERLEPTL